MTEDKGCPPSCDYFKIKNDWWDALVSYKGIPAKIRCLNFIIRRTYGWQKKEAPISLKEFSDATEITESNVAKILKGLKTEKLINVIKKKGSRQTIYSFNKYHKNWGCPETIQNDSFEQSETIKNDNLKLSKKIVSTIKKDSFDKVAPILVKNNIKTIKNKGIFSKDFLEFYMAYPVHKSKDAAWKAWQKRNGDMPSLPNIIKAIDAQKAEKKYLSDNGKFCPEWKHPSTWLNQGCWADEVEKPKQEEWTNYSH